MTIILNSDYTGCGKCGQISGNDGMTIILNSD